MHFFKPTILSPLKRLAEPARIGWLLLFATGLAGCQEATPKNARNRKSPQSVHRVDLGTSPTPLPAGFVRPSTPSDPLPRLIETIQSRGGKVTRDETGIVAIDWHRASINNLDLELLSEIPTLKRLYLTGTRIDSRGWMYLSTLPNLERLALWKTPFTDEDLKYLAGATNLQTLDLSNTRIEGSGFAHLSLCQSLETLILTNTPCQTACLRHLAKLSSLKRLDLLGTQIPGSALSPLKVLPHLEEVRMYVFPEALPILAELPHIRKVTLFRYSLDRPNQNLDALGGMKKLEVIVAEGNGVRDELFQHVSRCPNLREIHVRDSTSFTARGLAHLTACPSLRLLDVRTTNASAAGLRPIAQANPNLRILVHPIKSHGLRDAFRSMGLGAEHSRDGDPRLGIDREMNITALRLEDAKVFLPSLQVIAKAIKPEKLEHLGLGHTDLTDEGLAHFRAGIPLKHLNLRDTKITQEGLKAFGSGAYPELPFLETLDLSGTTLDDECLAWIGTLNRLKSLSLANIQGVTDKGWANLNRLENLKTLEK